MGAIGGKLLGTGGSGFMIFILNEHTDRAGFISSLKLEPLDFDYSYNGAEVLLR